LGEFQTELEHGVNESRDKVEPDRWKSALRRVVKSNQRATVSLKPRV
jgi:hypothetical protein